MKTRLLMLLMLCLCVSAKAEGEKTHLVVWAKDGRKVAYALSETPKLSFTETNLVIQTSKLTVNYNLADMARFTYATSEDAAIRSLETGDNTFSFDGDMLLFPSLQAGSTVSIHTPGGLLVLSRTVAAAGQYSFPISHLDAGVYLVSVNGLTYKIVKR